jgi:translation initiation factor IF-2
MPENKTMRLNKVLKELNISLDRAVEHLHAKGYEVEERPTTKISQEEYQVLFNEFQTDKSKKVASREAGEEKRKEKEAIRSAQSSQKDATPADQESDKQPEVVKAKAAKIDFKTVGKIDLSTNKKVEETVETNENQDPTPEKKPQEVVVDADIKSDQDTEVAEKQIDEEIKEEPVDNESSDADLVIGNKTETSVQEEKEITKPKSDNGNVIETQYTKLSGPTHTGQKIDLTQFKKPEKKKATVKGEDASKKKRKRITAKTQDFNSRGNNSGNTRGGGKNQRTNSQQKTPAEEPTQAEIQKQIRETLEKLNGKSKKGKAAKYRKEKRDQHRQQTQTEIDQQEAESKILKVTEFVTVSEIAILMDIPPTNIISTCMSLGMMVTMNQRLDAETLAIVVEEFGFKVEFVSASTEPSTSPFKMIFNPLKSPNAILLPISSSVMCRCVLTVCSR